MQNGKGNDESIRRINRLTEQIIGCAIEVHRSLGPGLLESVCESALAFELRQAGVKRMIL